MNRLPSEVAAVVDCIDPDAYAASTVTGAWIPLKNFRRLMAILMAGDIVSTGTIDAKWRVATSVGGANAADVTGAAITQLTQAGTDSNKQAVLNLDTAKVAHSARYTHAQLSVTLGTAGADFGAVVLGFDPREGGAQLNDSTTVDEIV